MGSKFCSNQIGQQLDLAVGKLISKRQHSIAAFGDLFVNFGLGFEFKFARAQAGNYGTVVDRFAIAIGSVANSAVLTKERCFVKLAVRYLKNFRAGIETSRNTKDRKHQYYQQLNAKTRYNFNLLARQQMRFAPLILFFLVLLVPW